MACSEFPKLQGLDILDRNGLNYNLEIDINHEAIFMVGFRCVSGLKMLLLLLLYLLNDKLRMIMTT